MAKPTKDQDEAKLAKLAKRILAMPPKPRETPKAAKPKRRSGSEKPLPK